jgi:hypothetical protein
VVVVVGLGDEDDFPFGELAEGLSDNCADAKGEEEAEAHG